MFVFKDCHLGVVKTFDSYWLILGDFSNYFMRYFLKKKRFKNNKQKKLKGKIYIGYCIGHDSLILFFDFKEYKQVHKTPLPLNFWFG